MSRVDTHVMLLIVVWTAIPFMSFSALLFPSLTLLTSSLTSPGHEDVISLQNDSRLSTDGHGSYPCNVNSLRCENEEQPILMLSHPTSCAYDRTSFWTCGQAVWSSNSHSPGNDVSSTCSSNIFPLVTYRKLKILKCHLHSEVTLFWNFKLFRKTLTKLLFINWYWWLNIYISWWLFRIENLNYKLHVATVQEYLFCLVLKHTIVG